MSRWFDGDYDPETYPRMGMLLKKKRESSEDAGFFELIQFLFGFNYLDVDGGTIDRMFWSRVALRTPSPIVVNSHDEDEGVRLTYTERVEIARMMYAYYKVKWEKQKAVVAIEYDPIHNYLDEWSDTSTGALSKTGSTSASRTDTPNVLVTKSNTRTDNLVETETLNTTQGRTDNITKTTTFGKRKQQLTTLQTLIDMTLMKLKDMITIKKRVISIVILNLSLQVVRRKRSLEKRRLLRILMVG